VDGLGADARLLLDQGLREPERVAAGEPGLHLDRVGGQRLVGRAGSRLGRAEDPGDPTSTLETTVAESAPQPAQATRRTARATRCLMSSAPVWTCPHP